MTDSKFPLIPWSDQRIFLLPITEYSFSEKNIHLTDRLHHGFTDLEHLFPTWQGFLNRSLGKDPSYPDYMAFLLCKSNDLNIIGVLAVQLIGYDKLLKKKQSCTPSNKGLYLSQLDWC